MDFWQIVMTPFSLLLKLLCQAFNSYAVGLFLFAVVVKLILAPLQYKGKKSMIKTTVLNGQLEDIKKRCGNDKERYSREVQELYTKNNINPMGGCGWSMLPLLVLMPLYAIIRRPFKYLMRLTESATTAVADVLGWTSAAVSSGAEFTTAGYNELYLSAMMNSGNLDSAKAAVTAAGGSAASMFVINFGFLGLDLALTPSLVFWKSDLWLSGDYWGAIGLFLLPVISAGLSALSMVISTKTNAMSKDQEDAAKQTNRSMMIMMPLMSLWIGFTLPAGLCIYWIANSILGMVQELIFSKMLKKDYEAAQKAIAEQARKSKEEEKARRRAAAERKAAALAAGKSKKKGQQQQQGKAKSDLGDVQSASRVGIRAYARGRAYDPNRYPVTPYHDVNDKNGQKSEKEEDLTLTEEEKSLLKEEGVEIPAPAEETAEPVENIAVERTEDGEEPPEYEAPYEE